MVCIPTDLNDGNQYNGEVIPMWDADSKKKILEKLPFNLDNSYSYGIRQVTLRCFK